MVDAPHRKPSNVCAFTLAVTDWDVLGQCIMSPASQPGIFMVCVFDILANQTSYSAFHPFETLTMAD